jgi:signal transduction histidine kinase/ActR/RegA family two-component response regulator
MAARTRAPRSRAQLRKAAPKRTRNKRTRRTPPRKVAKSLARGKDARASTIEMALATFAHEVRTPLTGILALSSLLETSGLPERERGWVESIKASAEHLSALATLFVDAARHRGPGLSIRHDFFDLRTLTQACANSLAGRAAAKGLTATAEIDPALPVFAVGDPVRLRAALENLVDNAVKFTDSGSVAFSAARSATSKRKAGIGVAFHIADSGAGLSVNEIKRLFKPFSQSSVAISRRFGGAGLGLSSVRQLARAMGGDVTVKPRRGGGTVFTLTVVLDEASDRSPSGDADRSRTAAGIRPLKILSIEDNPFGRVVLNAVLQELGHEVEFVGRGEEAPQRLAQGTFDLVLMDMVLPGIDGIEAIRRIRSGPAPASRIAIIGLSGRGDDEAAARAVGANGFLLKPVSPRELALALADVLGEAPGTKP